MSVHTHKMVNGRRVELTRQEIAELDASDATFHNETLPKRAARQARLDSLRQGFDVEYLGNILRNATAAEIEAYFNAAVTTPEQAIGVLRTLCKLLAVRVFTND